MAEIINLRSVRKARARAEAESAAARNRAIHGRTKAQKLLEKGEKERAARAIDGAALEKDSGD
ncbi:MAG: DUF4169 family protein [Sphingobium phenoxybenzoativorans]|uniref:DUF4169 family protein n=1 Tax=Sphingobium phenoxybenzoativorans TaxID=1592790 RepID=UPI0008720244|nr:DUF4169 family protein [Sphingobium phenoxybenzoativorans]